MKIGRQILMPAYIRPDQKAALAALAAKRNVSQQALLREALDLLFAGTRAPKMKGAKP